MVVGRDETATGLGPTSPVSNTSCRPASALQPLALFLFCLFILFHNLGGAALFEPDEGRNSEIAREILLLNDWVTPHDNFVPALDKPVFFYWWIAFCYKVIGISEWSARLPSALAALGSVILIYLFVRRFIGSREAAWSAVILSTNIESFALARIVIFDAALTFFMTLSLCSFYWATHAGNISRRRIFFILMYASMGVGTLLKGPIGTILPAMVIFFYLLIAWKWAVLRSMNFVLGAVIFFAIVAPWYIWVEVRNPGYLHYFLWEENFVRFLTPHFQRPGPWYYFLFVLMIGFLPWTPLIPVVMKDLWKRLPEENAVFLAVWSALPFLFFSLSSSKLPHYILPMYPPLCILTGQTLASILTNPSRKRSWLLFLPWLCEVLPLIYLSLGSAWPTILPGDIREAVARMPQLYLLGALMLLAFAAFSVTNWRGEVKNKAAFYPLYCSGLLIFFLFASQMMKSASVERSAKELANKAAPFIDAEGQSALYDTYLAGLPFYLRVSRPIWVVSSGNKSSIMGSFYIAEKHPQPAAGYGKVLFTFEEFAQQWKKSTRRLFVFVREKNLSYLKSEPGVSPKELAKAGDVILVVNP